MRFLLQAAKEGRKASMSGLILKLRPFEQLMINGVIAENGDRKTRLRVRSEGANILRLRDAMRPEDATTPVKRAFYAAQMAVAGALTPAQARILISQALSDYSAVDAENIRNEVDALARSGDFYKAMRFVGSLPETSAARESPRQSRISG